MARRNIVTLQDVEFGSVIYTRHQGKVVAVKPTELRSVSSASGSEESILTLLFATGDTKYVHLRTDFRGNLECAFKFFRTIKDAIEGVNMIKAKKIDGEQLLINTFNFSVKRDIVCALGADKWVWNGYKPIVEHIPEWYFQIQFDCNGVNLVYTCFKKIYDTREECALSNEVHVVNF